MSVLRVARAATGRDAVIKFAGCYHGHADGFLVEAGSGAITLGVPTSPGVPQAAAALTPHRALQRPRPPSRRSPTASKGGVAAILVEPIAGNMGVVPPERRLPRGLARVVRSHRRPARVRRGDQRLPGLARRRPAVARRAPRPDLPRQDHRRRPAGRCLRRPRGSDAHRRAGRARVSGRHALRQSARDDGRTLGALATERQAVREARTPRRACWPRVCRTPPTAPAQTSASTASARCSRCSSPTVR